MNTSTSTATNVQDNVTDLAACACHLYDAECALHAAHQSGIDTWINAAGDSLHRALAEYLAAAATSAQRTSHHGLGEQQAAP